MSADEWSIDDVIVGDFMISDEAENSMTMPSIRDSLEKNMVETKQLRGTGNMVCN